MNVRGWWAKAEAYAYGALALLVLAWITTLYDPQVQHIAVGIGFAVLVPWAQIYWTQVFMWHRLVIDAKGTRDAADRSHRRDLPAVVGLLERTLYFAAILLNVPAFIGIWLALKVAGNWKPWSKSRRVPGDRDCKPGEAQVEVVGRHEFNTYLIGTAQSVLFGVGGAQITRLLSTRCALEAPLTLGAALLELSLGLLLWASVRAHEAEAKAQENGHA